MIRAAAVGLGFGGRNTESKLSYLLKRMCARDYCDRRRRILSQETSKEQDLDFNVLEGPAGRGCFRERIRRNTGSPERGERNQSLIVFRPSSRLSAVGGFG
jgi:hypothetical protein